MSRSKANQKSGSSVGGVTGSAEAEFSGKEETGAEHEMASDAQHIVAEKIGELSID